MPEEVEEEHRGAAWIILPTYDEAIAKLMSVMKEAAAGKLVRTIAAIRDQKEQQAA